MTTSNSQGRTDVDHYTVLGLPPPRRTGDTNLASDAIKAAYRRTLLLHHPDKVASNNGSLTVGHRSDVSSSFTVDQIVKAYECLSDPVARTEYEHDFLNLPNYLLAVDRSKNVDALDKFDLEDFEYNESSQSWSKSCRCGGAYTVTVAELDSTAAEGELVLTCYSCSLCIKVTFASIDDYDTPTK